MLQTLDEIRAADLSNPSVINGVDNPNLMSVDSTTPITTGADVLPKEEEEVEEVEKKGEKKEEVVEKEGEEKEEKEEKPPEKRADEPKGIEKRIGELTKKWRSTERELEYERAKKQELEEELKQLKAKIPSEGRPQKEDFDEEDDYIEALTEWKVKDALRKSQEETLAKVSDREEQDVVKATNEELDKAFESGRAKYNDFSDIVFDKDLVITPEMTVMMLESEEPEELMYYLAKNPDMSADIAKMSSSKAAREFGKIEVKIKAEREAKAKEEKEKEEKEKEKAEATKNELANKDKNRKVISNAPDPINPPRQTGVVEKDPENMSMEEYRAWREKNKR